MSEDTIDPIAAAKQWNAADRTLSSFEWLMFRGEVSPMLRSVSILVEILDEVPDRERMIKAHDWATRLLAPLRHKVVEDPLALSPARWVVDRDFDLSYHLRFTALPAPGTMEQVCEVAQGMAMQPFELARPLWEAMLVEGLEGGRAAYLLKLHHSIADGQGSIQMFEILHGERRETGRATALPVPAPEHISGARLALRGLLGLPGRAVRDTASLAGTAVGTSLSVIRRPERVMEGVRYAQSLGRMLGPPPAAGSILLEQRSLSRRYAVHEVSLPALKAAGKAAGGTLNDAFLAGLVGAMRRYHEFHGTSLEALSVALPISIRRPDDPPGANRFAGARIAAPVAQEDPAERIRLIGAAVHEARSEPALGFMDAISPLLVRLPPIAAATMTERITRSIDLQASNVKGLTRQAYLAGAKVERTFGFGAAPGPAVMVTLVSYLDICCIAFTINAAAIPDHPRFVECVRTAFDEVLALGGDGATSPEAARAR